MARTYLMTAGSVMAKARRMLQDNRPEMEYRTADADLVSALNECLGTMVALAPGLFATTQTHTCTAGHLQALENERAVALLDITGLPEIDESTLTLFSPAWHSATAAAPYEFIRLPAEPLRFKVNPPAVGGEVLQVRMVRAPAALTESASLIELPENYEPHLVEYLVGRIQMQDDEHVDSNRAVKLMEIFAAGVKSLAGG